MPTPPTGDMAWAASPIASRPGPPPAVSRSSETESSFTWSHVLQRVDDGASSARPARHRRGTRRSLGLESRRGAFRERHRRIASNRRGRSHDHLPGAERAASLVGGRLLLGKPEPEHVDRRAEVLARKPRLVAQDRVRPSAAMVSRARISSPSFSRTPRRGRPSMKQLDCLGLHPQAESRVVPRLLREEVEEIPLRHQRDEPALHRQVAQVGDGDCRSATRRSASAPRRAGA